MKATCMPGVSRTKSHLRGNEGVGGVCCSELVVVVMVMVVVRVTVAMFMLVCMVVALMLAVVVTRTSVGSRKELCRVGGENIRV